MNPENNIDDKLRSLGNAIGSDNNIVNNVMSRIEKEPTIKICQAKTQNIWRIIMKSPVSKLAAAAILIFAVIIGFNHFQLTSPVYGITDVSEILLNSNTVHLKGWICASLSPELEDLNIVQEGQEETRAPYEYWIDMNTGSFKHSRPSWLRYEDEKFVTSTYTQIYDGQFLMEVNEASKDVVFTKMSPYQKLIRKRKNKAAIIESLLPMLKSSHLYEVIGSEEIRNEKFNIWQVEHTEPSFGGDKIRLKIWVSSNNGHIAKQQIWIKRPNLKWYQNMEINKIEYNVSIPGNIFATQIPEGYSSVYSKENALDNELMQSANYYFYDYNGELASQRYATHASFTLNDGTVILGWSCSFNEHGSKVIIPDADSYQEDIFPNLVTGGPLPELLIVFYNISPINEKPDVKYQARHLTYTRKGDIFYEWSIYVPETKLDKYYGALGYNIHYHNSLNEKDGAAMLGEVGDIRIVNEEDFDAFVLGAMAELSGDGKAPEDITYEKVLRLAQEIRNAPVKQ